MANQPNQKLKILYVLKTLLDKTDDANGITTQELIEELAFQEIDAERKSINRDIQTLRDFGFDIRQRSHRYWYLAKRPLGIQEITMLVDAVQSAPFITDKITDELIENIKQFASVEQRKALQRRIEVPGRVKMQNEGVLKNLDIIQRALREKRKIEFQYFAYDIKKQRVPRKHGCLYITTPVRLLYADEFYYLITFNDFWAKQNKDVFTPYRVDRMLEVKVSKEPATKDNRISNYKTEDHISPSFGVYAAPKVPVVLEFDQSVMNPIVDKFGIEAPVFMTIGDRAQASVKAPLSPQFFGWLLQLGPKVKIVHPSYAAEEFSKLLERTQKMYRKTYRICSKTASRIISQDKFLELTEFLEHGLDEFIKENLEGTGFTSENEFDEQAWRLIGEWTKKQNISDGMNYGTLAAEMQNENVRETSKLLDSENYLAYGQLVGEAIAAVEPIQFAAPGMEENFVDTVNIYDPEKGTNFCFREPHKLMNWKRTSSDIKRWSICDGVWFEIRYENPDIETSGNCFFNAPNYGYCEVNVEKWMGVPKDADSWKAAAKLWQMISYRFMQI